MNEIVIKEDGSVVKRQIPTETPIDLLPAIEAVFANNATFKMKAVVDFSQLGEPFFGLTYLTTTSANPGDIWWSVNIRTLNLHTTFELRDEILMPSFANEGKFIELPWRPPALMTVLLGVNTALVRGLHTPLKRILVAHDGAGITWKLPLPNLHDNLELCHGQDAHGYPTAFKALQTALAQFKASKWNADLYHSWNQEHAPKMFRFKPKNDGFEQLPIDATNWTSLCQKVGSSFITNTLLHL